MIYEHQEAAEEGLEAACHCQQQAWKPELLSNRQPERFSHELDDKDEEEAVNTTTPEKCPLCGDAFAEKLRLVGFQFQCGTIDMSCGAYSEGRKCITRQRDQLAERAKELEAQLAGINEAAVCAVIQDERREG